MLSKKLLEALFLLQENILDLSVYMLDLSLENISYNEMQGKVKFIDVENVIIADQRQIKMSKKLLCKTLIGSKLHLGVPKFQPKLYKN